MKLPSKKTVVIIAIECGVLWGCLELLGHFLIQRIEKNRPSGMYSADIMNFEEPLLDFGLRKSTQVKMPEGWVVKTNFLGFRENEEVSLEKPANEYRIFMVGGSTVFGWGVQEEETISQYLQKAIPLIQGKKVRVINTGVPWYASWNEAALIFHKILSLKPDHILVLNGLNDTAKSLAPNWRPIYEGYADLPTQLAFQKRQEQKKFSPAELFQLSPTLNYFLSKKKMREQMDVGIPHSEVWQQYLQYMKTLKKMAELQQILFSIFYQPVMVVGKDLTKEEVAKNTANTRLPQFAETFKKHYLQGEEILLSDKELKIVSLKNIFQNEKEPIYLDGLHYNPQGNKIIAQAMAKNLASLYKF